MENYQDFGFSDCSVTAAASSSGPARLSEWWDVNMGITATDTHYTSSGQLDQAWLGTILFFLALIGCGFVEYSSCKVYTHLKNEIHYDYD